MSNDYSKLLGKITEKFGTQAEFANALGISERSVSLKLNNKVSWKDSEIAKAVEILEIDPENIPAYFLSIKFNKYEQKTPDKESDAHLKIYLNYIRKCLPAQLEERRNGGAILATLDLGRDRESLSQIDRGYRERRGKERNRRKTNATRSKALMKKFGFDHGYIKKLERRGLAFRKQGKKKMYDVRDVYEILEKEKEYLK